MITVAFRAFQLKLPTTILWKLNQPNRLSRLMEQVNQSRHPTKMKFFIMAEREFVCNHCLIRFKIVILRVLDKVGENATRKSKNWPKTLEL